MTDGTGEASRPKASFVVITYNHVDLIGMCLDGLLAQEVDFPVEMIVHDDASTDGTADVLREYDRRHPGRFRLLLQETNGGSAAAAMARALTAAEGEYVLFCDGDDYWDDPRKASVQVEFLDSRPDLVFCFHDTHRYSLDGRQVNAGDAADHYRDWTSAEIAATAWMFVPQQALAFRNVLKPYPPEMWLAYLSDVFLTRVLGHAGDGAYVGDRVRPTRAHLHPTSDYAAASRERQDVMTRVTALLIVSWLLRIGREDEAGVLTREFLIPHLTGRVGPPPPRFTWRHPGSAILVVRHRRRWGRLNRQRTRVAP